MNRIPKIHLWNRGTKRKPNYWVRYSVDGVEYKQPTKTTTQAEVVAYVQGLERQFRLGTWNPNRAGGTAMFAAYARTVLAMRTARGVGRREKPPNKSEHGHIENHLIPMFPDLTVEDVAVFSVVQQAFNVHFGVEERAGRTIRNIHSTLRAIFRQAVRDTIIPNMPMPLSTLEGDLPPPVDKDPKWRSTAVFTREEIAALLLCEDIPAQYRVMYVTWFLTGSRFGEIIELHVRDYARAIKPLGSLTLPALKTRRDQGEMFRIVPVHRDLRAWLDWWLETGYAFQHKRQPQLDDLLFPTVGKIRQNRGEQLCSHNEVYKQWMRNHLPAAGLRHRRLHDSRRTFLSIARSSGASKDIVRSITHKVSGDKVLDGYTTYEWEALCRELSAVKWNLPGPPGSSATIIKLGSRRRR